ncbi:hypothetical protein E3Q22_01025 [Wallemia mellicola]|uniref:Homeobox domain-containing protein n=2 Tax=Wallemia mellicola TaxID=1708541 RepID=A0A4T0PAD7_9BASI|nr:hypothetical protein WALSEDRAFT_62198 [Wallemia mellicola CBS 633.66]TIB74239.1 hypothetical protein E3Q24_00687 [Wallemia mellicola]EIM23528.1 hypothetical protein WALSEDRAFT_62198 [Wallemia mellicola CBS 633.66]TIB78788.1 hypothetical protein E3Q23_00603 [Wallemia mellicola]TIB81560.1 hypothetical protein E3Q22_01025 [Wallemia mellicola]TIB90372.1 hypothetical protein E3Q21_00221 [Wallemia mellicola]|eukprot:XP_006956205.1 hypothetical protein WALSEDRAFT_62198 [Wallemia mellicola CBS 633.66]
MRLPFSKKDSNVIELPKPFSSHSREDSSSSSNASTSLSLTAQAPIKAKRKRANAYQLERLQSCYDANPFPSNDERQALATELNMSPNSVRIWYQNKRQALRNHEKAQSLSP